jgi:hypothetical protein
VPERPVRTPSRVTSDRLDISHSQSLSAGIVSYFDLKNAPQP